jgi:nitroimidazol reductase NimA-like FMN-containing flavoprotein (pyridoxamine 5'-phosphate oxidase superfamily)
MTPDDTKDMSPRPFSPAVRRKDREITDRQDIDAILRSGKVCHLAMVDGEEPYVVPMAYGYDGRSLFFHSAAEGRKVDVLRRNDRVCFEVTSSYSPPPASEVCVRSTSYESVIGTGRASFIGDREGKVRALDIIMRQQYGPGTWELAEAKVAKILIIKVDISSVSGKRSGR